MTPSHLCDESQGGPRAFACRTSEPGALSSKGTKGRKWCGEKRNKRFKKKTERREGWKEGGREKDRENENHSLGAEPS